MTYSGKPSRGCSSCRKSKKSCDRAQPVCSRCQKTNKPCGGYRDESTNWHEHKFGDRVHLPKKPARKPAPYTRSREQEREDLGRQFFFEHFVSDIWLSILKPGSLCDSLKGSALACSFAVIAQKEGGDYETRKLASQYYGQAIKSTYRAIDNERNAKDQNTLIAILLLGFYEYLLWEGAQSMTGFKSHVKGLLDVLKHRGREILRNPSDLALFRDVRSQVVFNALICDEIIPDFLVQWSQSMEPDPQFDALNKLFLLSVRVATLKREFRAEEKEEGELAGLLDVLSQDLIQWEQNTNAPGSKHSFTEVQDEESPYAWYGVRYNYATSQACGLWNKWRANRILVNYMQEIVWRRAQFPPIPYYRTVRKEMIAGICISAAGIFGYHLDTDPPKGSVASGHLMINALALAGASLLHNIQEPRVEAGAPAGMAHDQEVAQLDWVIKCLNYISKRVGIRHAEQLSRFFQEKRSVGLANGGSGVDIGEALIKLFQSGTGSDNFSTQSASVLLDQNDNGYYENV